MPRPSTFSLDGSEVALYSIVISSKLYCVDASIDVLITLSVCVAIVLGIYTHPFVYCFSITFTHCDITLVSGRSVSTITNGDTCVYFLVYIGWFQ